ncbi:hypothetical protein CDL12_10563 [Handroanthus impetiginosus]|uniref:NAB domain-containing protein n=1 Tax=Handroanthus impetiginosus TaxID=429701 RepID=A0A2G9HH84_9LAMI|nr:hypothetical protein CDL12_10563 [Handroanthus impetiginosus]
MTKHPLKGSLNFCSNHFDPQKEEQLKCMKIEIENQVQKILKLTKGINHGNKERNLRKKAEAIQLIEDFHKRYDSLYSLYQDLIQEVKKNFNDDSSSASNSDSESYYSPEELNAAKSNSSSDNSKVADSDNLEAESSDLEDTILKDKLTSSSEVKKTMSLDSEFSEINQAKDLEGKVASLKLEISTLCSQKNDLEEQLKLKFDEAVQMKEKMSMMETQIMELEVESRENDCRFDIRRKEYKDNEKKYLSRISELVAQANEMEIEISSLKHQKGKVDELFERETTQLSSQVESLMEQLVLIEKEKRGLKVEVNDLEREIDTLRSKNNYLEEEVNKISQEAFHEKERVFELQVELEKEKQESYLREYHLKKKNNELEEVISKLRDENEQAQSRLSYSRSNFQIVERKVDEMAEEFREHFEDKYRILSRRIRVAEQLQVENKEWYRKTKEAYEEQYKELQERAAKTVVELKHVKDLTLTANDVLTSLDSVALKFEEYTANFLNRISKASCELKFAKHWATRKNKALLHVKDDLDCLLRQLDDKEAEILVFREKVWKSENKIRELEKMLKEKEDGMLGLKEEKREAIRQLCVWIDYHRSRSDYYKKMLSEMNIARRRAS